MNVFDFDKTIYRSDSTVDFYLFCLKRHPKIIKYLPTQLYGILKYKIHRCSKEFMKEAFFSFLSGLEDVDCDITVFVKENANKIQKWYTDMKQESDVVISASPEFLLEKFSEETSGFCVIASKVEKKNGKFYTKNCYGQEKVTRFKERFPEGRIENFYSDSISDLPMAELAEKAYLVKNGKISKWFIY